VFLNFLFINFIAVGRKYGATVGIAPIVIVFKFIFLLLISSVKFSIRFNISLDFSTKDSPSFIKKNLRLLFQIIFHQFVSPIL